MDRWDVNYGFQNVNRSWHDMGVRLDSAHRPDVDQPWARQASDSEPRCGNNRVTVPYERSGHIRAGGQRGLSQGLGGLVARGPTYGSE